MQDRPNPNDIGNEHKPYTTRSAINIIEADRIVGHDDACIVGTATPEEDVAHIITDTTRLVIVPISAMTDISEEDLVRSIQTNMSNVIEKVRGHSGDNTITFAALISVGNQQLTVFADTDGNMLFVNPHKEGRHTNPALVGVSNSLRSNGIEPQLTQNASLNATTNNPNNTGPLSSLAISLFDSQNSLMGQRNRLSHDLQNAARAHISDARRYHQGLITQIQTVHQVTEEQQQEALAEFVRQRDEVLKPHFMHNALGYPAPAPPAPPEGPDVAAAGDGGEPAPGGQPPAPGAPGNQPPAQQQPRPGFARAQQPAADAQNPNMAGFELIAPEVQVQPRELQQRLDTLVQAQNWRYEHQEFRDDHTYARIKVNGADEIRVVHNANQPLRITMNQVSDGCINAAALTVSTLAPNTNVQIFGLDQLNPQQKDTMWLAARQQGLSVTNFTPAEDSDLRNTHAELFPQARGHQP